MTEAPTIQAQMRAVANKIGERGGTLDLEAFRVMAFGADAIDRLERELAYERTINERLRGIKQPPACRPDYLMRAMLIVAALYVFWIVWPILQYVFNPGG